MTSFQPHTLFVVTESTSDSGATWAPGLHAASDASVPEVSPDLWSLCAPGVSLPGCGDRERATMPLLLRAMQTLDPELTRLSDIRPGDITSAYSVLVRLSPSREMAAVLRNLTAALFERFVDHDRSPYPEVTA